MIVFAFDWSVDLLCVQGGEHKGGYRLSHRSVDISQSGFDALGFHKSVTMNNLARSFSKSGH